MKRANVANVHSERYTRPPNLLDGLLLKQRSGLLHFLMLFMFGASMVVTLVRVLSILTLQVSLGVYAIHPTAPRIDVPDAIKTSWGAYSPYYSASKYVHPPQGCSVNQVNLVSYPANSSLLVSPLIRHFVGSKAWCKVSDIWSNRENPIRFGETLKCVKLQRFKTGLS